VISVEWCSVCAASSCALKRKSVANVTGIPTRTPGIAQTAIRPGWTPPVRRDDNSAFRSDDHTLRSSSKMAKVCVRACIQRPICDVFALVSDHEMFLSGISGTTTKIIQAGTAERNGLGCIREVRVGDRARYVEEITQWQPPYSFEYLIREASIPIRHYGSRLDFAARQESTDITWQSHFDVPLPVIGWALGIFMKRRYEVAFSAFLSQARVVLERST
jgi:hypothetical protein